MTERFDVKAEIEQLETLMPETIERVSTTGVINHKARYYAKALAGVLETYTLARHETSLFGNVGPRFNGFLDSDVAELGFYENEGIEYPLGRKLHISGKVNTDGLKLSQYDTEIIIDMSILPEDLRDKEFDGGYLKVTPYGRCGIIGECHSNHTVPNAAMITAESPETSPTPESLPKYLATIDTFLLQRRLTEDALREHSKQVEEDFQNLIDERRLQIVG